MINSQSFIILLYQSTKHPISYCFIVIIYKYLNAPNENQTVCKGYCNP